MSAARRLALLLILALAAWLPAFAAEAPKVVYHLADEDKVTFALGNIRNHINGVGGPDKVQIVLVMHGPAAKAFVEIDAVDRVRGAVAQLIADGVEIDVCANTLKALKLSLEDMLPGMQLAANGGVVRIAELQSQGYLYIRP
jgi:intracellular sulfur oxidation DsrE/DsrF family protein